MSNARPKFKLRDSVISRPIATAEPAAPPAQGWKNLFKPARGALVPVRTTDPRIAHAQVTRRTDTKHPTQTPAPQLTRKTEAPPQQTLNRAVREKRSYASVVPPAPSPLQPRERDLSLTRGGQTLIADDFHSERDVSPQRKSESKNKIVLIAAALGLIGGALLLRSSPSSEGKTGANVPTEHSAIDAKTLQQEVEFHRHSTGWKLNGDRVRVQQENDASAPPLALDEHKVKAPDIMNGVPIQGEAPAFANAHDRLVPVPPNDTEANVMYQLQDEQAAAQWEKEARAAYIKQFIANARAEGLVVEVDKYGNVLLNESATKSLNAPRKGYWMNTDQLPRGAQGSGR